MMARTIDVRNEKLLVDTDDGRLLHYSNLCNLEIQPVQKMQLTKSDILFTRVFTVRSMRINIRLIKYSQTSNNIF